MKVIYDRKEKCYKLELSFSDKCYTCVNKNDCPLLEGLRDHSIVIKSSNFYKTFCKMYSYYVEPEIERKFRGFFWGDAADRGYKDDDYDGKDKYKYR